MISKNRRISSQQQLASEGCSVLSTEMVLQNEKEGEKLLKLVEIMECTEFRSSMGVVAEE